MRNIARTVKNIRQKDRTTVEFHAGVKRHDTQFRNLDGNSILKSQSVGILTHEPRRFMQLNDDDTAHDKQKRDKELFKMIS